MSSNLNKAVRAEHQNHIRDNWTAAPGQQHGRPSKSVGYLTTGSMADTMGLQAQSIRKRLSQTGSYFGLKPVKLKNRRLIWEADAVAKFLRGEAI